MIIIFFNIMPFVFIYVLNKKNMRNRLDDEDVQKKIGTMYATVDPKYTGSLYYNVVFLFRRSFFVLVTFMLFSQPGIAI